MNHHSRRILIGVLLVIFTVAVTTGCVTHTNVTIDSEPQGAEVRLDNRKVGETPVTLQLSNALWEDPVVHLQADGYRDMYGSLDKEIKGVNLAVGFFLFPPSLLWCYGPDQYQHYDMIEERE